MSSACSYRGIDELSAIYEAVSTDALPRTRSGTCGAAALHGRPHPWRRPRRSPARVWA